MEFTEEELNYGNFIKIKCRMCGEDFLYLYVTGYPPIFCDSCVRYRQYLRNKYSHVNHLGTTSISPHFSGDFDKERFVIRKEFRRLKIRKKEKKK